MPTIILDQKLKSPKLKSLLVIIVFILMLVLPVTYALIRNYFFTPKTEVKQVVPAPGEPQ